MSNTSDVINVIATLNNVEVHGKQNLSMLLGSIQTLEKVLERLKAEEVNADG